MRAEAVLEARGLTRYFGAIAATNGFDLALSPGELHALIGPNGAGKTTAVNQLAGGCARTAATSCSTAATSLATPPTGEPGPGLHAPSR